MGQLSLYEGGLDALRKLGVKGLYRGFGVNTVRMIPSVTVQFILYDQIRKAIGME